jgi:hypothetical protein
MKCINCKGEWSPPPGVTVTECPFCKESFAPTKVSKAYETAKDALIFIADTYGAEALLTKNLFSDIAPNLTEERELVKLFMDKGALEVLKSALNSSPSEQESAIKRGISKLPSYLQNSPDVISMMNDFVSALKWQVTELWSPQQFQPSTSPQSGGGGIGAPNINKIISFGGYDWRVLDVQDGKVLLLSDKIIEKRRYHSTLTSITWAECELRAYLNDSFYDSLGADRERVAETQLSNPRNLWSEIVGGNSTRDKIFLLSLDEVDKYFGNSGDYESKRRKCWNSTAMKYHQYDNGWYISNSHDKSRITEDANGEASWWWLRSPGNKTSKINNITLVNASGLIRVDGNIVTQNAGGVRPAMWVTMKS